MVGDNGIEKGTHAFVAPNDIVQCLPWNFMAHHCAGFFNYTHIGLDLVEPDNNEQNKEQFVLDTYETMVELAAYLCEQYKLDPIGFTECKVPGKKKKTLSVPVILSHKEAHALGGASNHGDPDRMWNTIKIGGVALTMDKFRADVNNRKGKANFYYVTDKWDKHISTGKKLPDKMVYTKGEKASGRISLAKYPYELGKTNLEEGAVTIPMERDDERWFPKTYPLHKPGYRVAYNDRTAAIKAAQIATEAAYAAGDIDKKYNIYGHMGEVLFCGSYKYKTGPAGPSASSAPISFGINASVLEQPDSAQ
ncbi:MAG: peptidoglycan recognition protein family protein [Methanimicrococcus sp.]|nr:peptidoglycan recognition protein family protein [Methanimicrococcus sp.]